MSGEFIEVNVAIGKTSHKIQMQKGVLFQNKGGAYCIFDDGTLKFQKAGTENWEDASQIKMTNYQWKAFQNVANNDGNASTYSQKDIEEAMRLYGDGKFKADMQKDLPSGYKLEHPKKNTPEKYVEVDVTNGKPTQSARLKFQIMEQTSKVKKEEYIYHEYADGVNFHQYYGAYTKINRADDGRVEKITYCCDEDENGLLAKIYDFYNYDSKGKLSTITRVTNNYYLGEGHHIAYSLYKVYECTQETNEYGCDICKPKFKGMTDFKDEKLVLLSEEELKNRGYVYDTEDKCYRKDDEFICTDESTSTSPHFEKYW